MNNRLTVYRYDADQAHAAGVMWQRLHAAGLDPHVELQAVVTLTPVEAERLREWQRREPERFGGC